MNALDQPLILAVAPNGARKSHADHPRLPLTPDEIAREAPRCAEAGAAMIHLHVRDGSGRHTLDAEAYRTAIAAIRRAVGDRLVIQATSEAAGIYSAAEQMAAMRALRPEAVSLALRELMPAGETREAAEFLRWLDQEEIFVQYILYTPEEAQRLALLHRRGAIPQARPFVLFVLGRYRTPAESSPDDLLPFLATREAEWSWAMCAFGWRENACAMVAAALGGHVRVGFENNLLLANGATAPDNAALVAQVAQGARLLGRPLADGDCARALLAAPAQPSPQSTITVNAEVTS